MGTETLAVTEPERFRSPPKIFRFWSVSFATQAFTRRLSNKPQAIDKPRYSNSIAPGSMVSVPGAIGRSLKSKQWRSKTSKHFQQTTHSVFSNLLRALSSTFFMSALINKHSASTQTSPYRLTSANFPYNFIVDRSFEIMLSSFLTFANALY